MGGILGGGDTISNVAPVAAGLRVQTSAYGLSIPICLYGRTRVTGNLIWFGDFTPIANTTTQSAGGKGGSVDSSNTTFTYTTSFCLALGEGLMTAVYSGWRDKDILTQAQVNSLFTFFNGSYSQTPWSYLTSKHAGQDLAYRGISYVAASNYNLGASEALPNHSFEVGGAFQYNIAGGIYGANPKDIVYDFLTNTHYGAGYPASKLGDFTAFSNFCIASGIFLSPAYTDQTQTADMLLEIMKATNSGVYFGEGLMKIVPMSDTNVTGNGVSYIASNTAIYNLTDDDFIITSGDPVKVTRGSPADAYNQVQIEFINSANQYNVEIATASDQAAIDTYGLIAMPPVSIHAITDAPTARLVAQMMLQRALYVRNTYEFNLSAKYSLLEPTDIVTITDSFLGLSNYAVRITSVEEASDNLLSIIAEDYPSGVTHSPIYPSGSGSGFNVNYNTAASNVAPPTFFEVPVSKSTTGLAVSVAVAGIDSNYGGCQVWASWDGITYKKVGETNGSARYGITTNTTTAAANQVQNVALIGNGGQVLSGSPSDAANLSSLTLVGNEYVGYTTSSLLSVNNYGLTLANRGAYQTAAISHAIGERFVLVDNTIVTSEDLDLSNIGKTIYFKFLAFNQYGAGLQLLSDVSPYAYTITGEVASLPPSDVSSISINGTKLSWTTVSDGDVAGYVLRFNYGQNTEWGTANTLNVGVVTDSPYQMLITPSNQVTIMIKAVDKLGNYSLNAASIVTDFGDQIVANVLETYDYQALSWPGVITNATVAAGNLQATQSDPFYQSAQSNFYTVDNASFYSVNYDAMEWISAGYTPSMAAVGSNLSLVFALQGNGQKIQYRLTGATLFFNDDLSYFYSADTTNFYAPPGEWLTWGGAITAQNQEYQWRVVILGGATAGLISAFTAQVDVPDVSLSLNNVSVIAGGSRLTGAIGNFNFITNIQMTLHGGSTATKLEILDYNATLGPLVIAKDNTGTSVAANIDALLQGY